MVLSAVKCKYMLLEYCMYCNDSYLVKDSGLLQSYIAVVKLLFLFPDILDFLAAVINRAVEPFER